MFRAGFHSATASTSVARTSKAWVVRHTSATTRTTRFCTRFSCGFDHVSPIHPLDDVSSDVDDDVVLPSCFASRKKSCFPFSASSSAFRAASYHVCVGSVSFVPSTASRRVCFVPSFRRSFVWDGFDPFSTCLLFFVRHRVRFVVDHSCCFVGLSYFPFATSTAAKVGVCDSRSHGTVLVRSVPSRPSPCVPPLPSPRTDAGRLHRRTCGRQGHRHRRHATRATPNPNPSPSLSLLPPSEAL